MRWAIRAAGLVSTVILARVLTPEDFGIVAMSALVIGLLTSFADMGTWQVLIRSGETERQPYDTAWTIMLVQGVVLAAILMLAAYPAAVFFKEPRVTAVMQVIAASSVISGFLNIGTVMFRRDLDFRSDFLFGFYSKLATVVPTIVVTLIYRSYWALVAGQMIGQLLEVLISYRMHPFRPRLSWVGWRRFVTFSMWMTPSNIANFLNQRADVFVVGHIANAAQMGTYNVASELSRMATAEIVTPMARAIFPNLSKLRNDRDALIRAFLLVLRTVSIISFAFGLGIAAMADDVVYLVLGSQWEFAVPLIRWLGIFGAFVSLQATLTGHILIVLNKERSMLVINWLRLAVFGGSVLVAAQLGTLVDVAMAAALSTAAITVGCTFYLAAVLRLPPLRMLRQIGRFLGISLLVYALVTNLRPWGFDSHALRLLVDVSVGTSALMTLLLLSWLVEGRPEGPEQRVVELVQRRWRTRPAHS